MGLLLCAWVWPPCGFGEPLNQADTSSFSYYSFGSRRGQDFSSAICRLNVLRDKACVDSPSESNHVVTIPLPVGLRNPRALCKLNSCAPLAWCLVWRRGGELKADGPSSVSF